MYKYTHTHAQNKHISNYQPWQQTQHQWECFVASCHDGWYGLNASNAMLAPAILDDQKLDLRGKS